MRARLAAVAVLATGLFGIPALGAMASTSAGASGCDIPAGTWSMYQGGPDHSANSCSSITTGNVATLRPAWYFATPGAVSATPTVAAHSVYIGESTGLFYALDRATGAKQWTFDITTPQSCYLDQPHPFVDKHSTGFGKFPSSAALSDIRGTETLFVGGGGSLFALDAANGKCLWAQDTDPATPSSSVEVESSPVVDTSVNPPEVLVGNDDNSSANIAVTGLMAFNAVTGGLLWKYEPERDITLRPAEFCGSDARTLSWGDGGSTAGCTPDVPDLAPNSTDFADACGDVWSSPALDARFVDPAGKNTFQGSGSRPPAGWAPKQITAGGGSAKDGLAVFGTGNCSADPAPATALAHGDYVDNQGVFALDPVTGVRVWDFVSPYEQYDNNAQEPWGGDDDFGSSAVLTSVSRSALPKTVCAPTGSRTGVVVEGSKNGFAYGICERTGKRMWSVQASQPGQLAPSLVGAIGGFIGSPAVGSIGGAPTAFFTSAVPLPFSNDGFRQLDGGDNNISSCPGPGLSSLPVLPACPDLSLLNDPTRLVSLHAIDVATGRVDWQAPSLPSYAAVSFTNGVVFDPQTTGFGVVAYDAANGVPLWAAPLGAAPSSAAAIAGDSIFIGAGLAEQSIDGEVIPPQALGVWSFSMSAAVPNISPPPLPVP